MSLLNDTLRDLDHRDSSLVVARGPVIHRYGDKNTHFDRQISDGFSLNIYTGVIVVILISSFTLGGVALHLSAREPNHSYLSSVEIPTPKQSAAVIDSDRVNDLAAHNRRPYSNKEMIGSPSQTSGPSPRAAKIEVVASHSISSDNSDPRPMLLKAPNRTNINATILPKIIRPPKKENTIESSRLSSIANGSGQVDVNDDVTDAQLPLITKSVEKRQPALIQRKTGLVTAIMPRYIQPPKKAVKTLIKEESSVSERKTVPAIGTTKQVSSQNIDLHPRISQAKETSSHLALTDNTSDAPTIEVIRLPLSADQQLLNSFHVAADAYKKRNYSEAEEMLKDILLRDNAQHKARLLLARLFTRQQLDKQAELTISNGLLHYPHHSPYVSFYARLLAKQGRDSAAIDALKNGLPDANQNAQYHALLAGLYQRTGNSIAAAKSYLVALRLDPTYGEWWMGLGISSEQSGDEVTAEKAYREALQNTLSSKVQHYVEQRLVQLAASIAARTTQSNN